VGASEGKESSHLGLNSRTLSLVTFLDYFPPPPHFDHSYTTEMIMQWL
jgi:hypothetical protein